MDALLAWVGKWAGLLAIAMVVPALFVLVPWLMSAIGMMPASAAGRLWEQAQPFALGYVLIWIGMGVVYAIGRSADARIIRKTRG